MLQSSGEAAALEFYCEKIMPALLPPLQKSFKETYGQEPKDDDLISLLGFTPDTVIVASRFVQPETLVVLYTRETKGFLDAVLCFCRITVASFFHESFSEIPITNIYISSFRNCFRAFSRRITDCIERTGGKKTMSGSLAIASRLLDIDLMDIDDSKYKPEFRKPHPESTYYSISRKPTQTTS